MKHGSLFSGIGGFDLAAQWMGWENVFHCEWMPFPQKVLKHYWPNAISYEDITKTDFTIHHGNIDILTGGFPCQPYSAAGKRKGKNDDRHLWPEMCRAIREIAPTWVVGENVRGLTNWNGGLVFDEVCADLENLGYQVTPFLIPACSVNAPHKRERIWFVAYANGSITGNNGGTNNETEGKIRGDETGNVFRKLCCDGNASDTKLCSNELPTKSGLDMERCLLEGRKWEEKTNGFGNNDIDGNASNTTGTGYDKRWQNDGQTHSEENGTGLDNRPERFGNDGNASDTCDKGLQGGQDNGIIGSRRKESHKQPSRFICTDWKKFPTQSPVCGGNDGVSTRLDGITFSKWRNESIKGYGNAVVPKVVFQIFKTIELYEQMHLRPAAT